MESPTSQRHRGAKAFEWSAKLLATAVVVLPAVMVITESGTGPQGAREWAYLKPMERQLPSASFRHAPHAKSAMR